MICLLIKSPALRYSYCVLVHFHTSDPGYRVSRFAPPLHTTVPTARHESENVFFLNGCFNSRLQFTPAQPQTTVRPQSTTKTNPVDTTVSRPTLWPTGVFSKAQSVLWGIIKRRAAATSQHSPQDDVSSDLSPQSSSRSQLQAWGMQRPFWQENWSAWQGWAGTCQNSGGRGGGGGGGRGRQRGEKILS